MKLLRVMKEVSSLSEEDYKSLEFTCYQSLLKSVAKNNHLDDSDIRMRGVLRNEIKALDRDYQILPRYVEALNHMKKNYTGNIDINFVNDLHSLLTGDNSSFRTKEDDNVANRVVLEGPDEHRVQRLPRRKEAQRLPRQ